MGSKNCKPSGSRQRFGVDSVDHAKLSRAGGNTRENRFKASLFSLPSTGLYILIGILVSGGLGSTPESGLN